MKRRKRGFRGLGRIGRMGGGSLVPVAAGSILTGGTTLALRTFITPTPGTAGETAYRWAPAIGMAVGLVGSGLMMFVGGKAQGKSSAMLAAASSLFLGATLLGSERLNVAKPGGMLALAGTGPIVTEETPAGTQGLAALMPEYGTQGLGQIVMQPLNGAYGETVNVAGLGAGFRSDAFGKAPY